MPRKKLTKDEYKQVLALAEDGIKRAHVAEHIICNVSGGNASAVCLARCLDRYGDKVRAVFADTNTEDPDLYRFLDDVQRVFGIEVDRIDNDGKTIFDVFDKEGAIVIRKQNLCVASRVLKRDPLNAYAETIENSVVAIGLDWTEPERIADRMQAWKDGSVPREFIFPLAVNPRWSECDYRTFLEDCGIPIPKLYGDGFIHNNCAGKCVLGGLSTYINLLETNPEEYAKVEAWEKPFTARTAKPDQPGWTICRDQRNGKTTPYPLWKLREDYENGRKFRKLKPASCGCVLDEPQLTQLTIFDKEGKQ